MIRLIAAAAMAVAFVLPAHAQDEQVDLVTVVTSNNPQVQLMSMVLTTQAVAKGRNVHMLLCGPGGDIALIDAPESATASQPPRGASPQGMLTGLIDRGATVEVCAIYLPGLGADADALIDGVGVAAPPAMAETLLDEAATVWSF